MKKALGVLLVLGLLAAPASADLKGSPQATTLQKIPGVHGTIGIYYGGNLYYTPFISAQQSDTFVLTFGFHWPYYTAVYADYLHFSFVYDNSEVEVLGMQGAGPFVTGSTYNPGHAGNPSIPVTLFPNPSSGVWGVSSLYMDIPNWQTSSNALFVPGSAIFPFMQVTLHMKQDGINDGFLDAVIGSANLIFRLSHYAPSHYVSGGGIASPSLGVAFTPEPASLSLLGLGLVAVGGGIWRRRR
jgi:hypothetical protein